MSYRQEEAKEIQDGPLQETARRFLEKLKAGGRDRGVFGIYGERGSGKTSFLLTLLGLMDQENQGPPSAAQRFLLPKQQSRLFAPAQMRRKDKLIFTLIDFLEKGFGGNKDHIKELREAEIHREEIAKIIDYRKEISPSIERLPDDLVDEHVKAAATTSKLVKGFESLIGDLLPDKVAQIVLLIDDLDLQPHRAHELLETLHLFLNLPQVIVLIAADHDLLLKSIAADLQVQSPGLAGKLLAKWIPYSEFLPVPSFAEAMKELGLFAKALPLSTLWAAAAVKLDAADKADAENAGTERDQGRQPWLHRLWKPVRPSTYRALIALHNQAIDATTDQEKISSLLAEVGLAETLRLPWFTLLLSVDIQYPEANLHGMLMRDPVRLTSGLRELWNALAQMGKVRKAKTENEREEERERREKDARESLDAAYSRYSFLRVAQSPESEGLHRALEHLGEVLEQFASLEVVTAAARAIILVSLNANALTRIRGYLGDVPEEELQHIDLTALRGTESRPSIETINKARREALQQLRQRGTPDLRGRFELRAEAPLPFLVWLGWELRRLKPMVVYNYFGGSFVPLKGPDSEMLFRDTRQRDLLAPTEVVSTEASAEGGDAIVLIDAPGISTDGQLSRFLDEHGQPVACRLRRRLAAPKGTRIDQSNLLLLLQDCVEELNQLRQRESISRFHLGLVAPDAVAFFLGQQLNNFSIVLYEFYQDDQSYRRVFPLANDEPQRP